MLRRLLQQESEAVLVTSAEMRCSIMAQDGGVRDLSSLAVAGFVGDEPVGMSMIGPTDRFEKNHDRYLELLREAKAAIFGAASI